MCATLTPLLIRQVKDMEKPPTKLFTVRLTLDEDRMYKELAQYRGQLRAGLLRQWIRKAHKQMEKRST